MANINDKTPQDPSLQPVDRLSSLVEDTINNKLESEGYNKTKWLPT